MVETIAKTPFTLTVKRYYWLTKPGIIYGNIMTAAAGFFLASRGHIDFALLLSTLLGTALIIASACVFNNIADRDIDAYMSRTKARALATGKIKTSAARNYAICLGILGVILLGVFTNPLVVLIGIVGFVDYVVVYTKIKRRSPIATLVGSISGSTAIIAGYCAVTGRLDSGAVLLFLIMTVWQMPHFYAIALRRSKEYKAAKIPVLPLVEGVNTTIIHILMYTLLYALFSFLLWVYGYTGFVYLIIMTAISYYWLWLGVQGFKKRDTVAWARKMFLFSLIVLTTFSVLISLEAWLP